MQPETRIKKKYAAGRASTTLNRPEGEATEPTELLARMQAMTEQVAKLQRAVKLMSKRPRIRAVPAQAAPTMTQAEWEADQQRRKATLAGLIAEAQALVPDPPDSPTRKACRESPLDEIIVEKFRRQGFNL